MPAVGLQGDGLAEFAWSGKDDGLFQGFSGLKGNLGCWHSFVRVWSGAIAVGSRIHGQRLH